MFVLALGLVAVPVVSALRGHQSAAHTTTSGPQPTKAYKHAAGTLRAFVYERRSYRGGAGGNVKACHANWHPPTNTVAQLYCWDFGQLAISTRFQTRPQANAYFNKLASQGCPGAGDWGRCRSWLPRGTWHRGTLTKSVCGGG